MSMNSDITPFVFLKCKARLAETIAFVNVIIAGYTVDWSVERGGRGGALACVCRHGDWALSQIRHFLLLHIWLRLRF